MAFDSDPKSVLPDLIGMARKAGADAAEASLSESQSLTVEVRLGDLEGVERSEDRSIALRAFVGKRQAAATSTDLSPRALQELAERVVAMAKLAPEDKYCGLADQDQLARHFPDLDVEDSAEPDAKQLEAMARAAEDAARAVPGVTNSEGAGADYGRAASALATSDGFFGQRRGTSYGIGMAALAEKDGKKESGYDSKNERFFADLPTPEGIGRFAGERAVSALGARKIASQKAPIIFENRIARVLLGPMFGAISGASVARGVSFLKDKLGERIFPAGFTMTEDPLLRRGISSRAYDGEGVATQKRDLIDDGVVTTWLLNTSAAKQLGLRSTGHASAGHGGPPGISTTNVIVKPGQGSLSDLMKDAGKGLLVIGTFSPSINQNTGDLSVGIQGFWFEDGAIAYPVSEVTIAGNLVDMYARVVAGGDSERRGGLEAPSLLVDDITIAGL
jgi:PmbA protein